MKTPKRRLLSLIFARLCNCALDIFYIQQVLIEAIRKDWNNLHLLDILTKVNERMADKHHSNGVFPVQVPYQNHTLRAKVHLGMKA